MEASFEYTKTPKKRNEVVPSGVCTQTCLLFCFAGRIVLVVIG